MTERAMASRYGWQAYALPALFGAEFEVSDPWPALMDAVARTRVLTAEVRSAALDDAAGLGTAGDVPLPSGDTSSGSTAPNVQDVRAPMRVVLMGRTMAGKSSLLTAMTGSYFDRIGDGRQRFSRDIFGAASAVSEHIEVVDTPGVGAHGGADDTAVALKAALDADVVVWVNSSDSIQEESAAALRLLGVIGKPIIVALNCRQSLDGVGRLNLLRFPDRVFGSKDGLVDEIRRHMAEAGVEPLDVVYVHALAAAEALANDEVDVELRTASRIRELTDALLQEQATHSESRRALRLVDGQRQQVEELALSLQRGAVSLRAQAASNRDVSNDVHARLNRVVRATGEAMASDVEAAVGRRRDWHLTVTDFGKSVLSGWDDEVNGLQQEIAEDLESRVTSLTDDVQSTLADTESEWTSPPPDQFALGDLAGFDTVWGNRLVRAGVGIGGSLAVIGVGLLLGGPVGVAVATIGGPVTGIALTPLKNLADRIFLGRSGVLRKRREEVSKQVGPILDDLTEVYLKAITTQLDEVRDKLSHERSRSEEHSTCLDRVSSQWTRRTENLRDVLGELDRETTSALLRINGRERLARSIRRATRVPGVCILAEFEDVAFWESWLFPPDLGETLAGGRCPILGAEAASSLSYTLSLVDASVRLKSADDTSAVLSVDADIPPAITETWSSALTAHIHAHVQIETTRRNGHL